MSEKPLERLNYHNGQRLEAADLKAEQDYHIRTRRWLNKSLYSAGIARGLEVRREEDTPFVIVSPGLALDNEGREIILLEEQRVEVKGFASGSNDARVEGPYLTIEYAETPWREEHGGCTVRGTNSETLSAPAWGGPARILAQPILAFSLDLPHAKSNKIVLAQVEVKNCKIYQLNTGVRRYVGAASAAMVREYALEGEREVAFIPKESFPTLPATAPPLTDVEVVGRIYFHIRGRQPNGVTLYLRAEVFSPLHYTELGAHQHSLSVNGGTGESNPVLNSTRTSHAHSNDSNNGGTLQAVNDPTSNHGHSLEARKGYIGGPQMPWPFTKGSENSGGAAFFLIEREFAVPITFAGAPPGFSVSIAPETDTTVENILDDVNGSIGGGGHAHSISGLTATNGPDLSHTHSISGSGTSGFTAGTQDPLDNLKLAREGKHLGFVDGLQIAIDGKPQTDNILNQILNSLPDPGRWNNKLGDGNPEHPFVATEFTGKNKTQGTGPIKLDFLPGTDFTEGEHIIELRAPRKPGAGKYLPNGGKILYNLYIE